LLRFVYVTVIDPEDLADAAADLHELLGARVLAGIEVQLDAGGEPHPRPEFRGQVGPSRRRKRRHPRGDVFGDQRYVTPGEDFPDRVERVPRRLEFLNAPKRLQMPLVRMPPPPQPKRGWQQTALHVKPDRTATYAHAVRQLLKAQFPVCHGYVLDIIIYCQFISVKFIRKKKNAQCGSEAGACLNDAWV
jgi:hypothetical protein